MRYGNHVYMIGVTSRYRRLYRAYRAGDNDVCTLCRRYTADERLDERSIGAIMYAHTRTSTRTARATRNNAQ